MADKKANPTPTSDSSFGNGDAFEHDTSDAASPSLSRFRLPRFFSHGVEGADELAIGELPDDPVKAPRPPAEPVTAIGKAIAAHSAARNGHLQASATTAPEAPVSAIVPSTETSAPSARYAPQEAGGVALSESDFSALVEQIGALTEQIREVNERESAMERVFNTLHSELADYKNDFLYEHLKPVVRPLLFLFDSLEQFDGEVAMAQSSGSDVEKMGVLSATVVRENVSYFRDQLVEALRVCEVALMDPPTGTFNAKMHKAVDVLPVPEEEDGQIMRVVRSGWFLNGQLLRPAEVVVGRFRAQS